MPRNSTRVPTRRSQRNKTHLDDYRGIVIKVTRVVCTLATSGCSTRYVYRLLCAKK